MSSIDSKIDDPVPPKKSHAAQAGSGALALGALGVVYGDIGTSPLYALREAVRAAAGDAAPDDSQVIGALSIVFWALILVVAVKYAIFVLRADNEGEGGTLAIMTIAKQAAKNHPGKVLFLGMLGASLFFGDAVITPAISVTSAVEGLQIAAPSISHFTVPIAIGILVGLFVAQRFGTGGVSRIFGPVTLVWFLVLGAMGAVHIADDPTVFRALNPFEAVRFVHANVEVAAVVIGAAFLAVTGAEALYVDLGHFGRKPILLAWFGLVLPCLLLNYFGQGAYLLASSAPVDQPFFQMAPDWGHIPLVILATIATVIASQAVISGAFSLTRQAIQLHMLPRMNIVHTSATQTGQIYIPQVNWMLLACVLLLVVGFGSSEHMASAYGISVTGEMMVTTLLLFIVMRGKWHWSLPVALAVATPAFLIDFMFLGANALKFFEGGWVSVTIASILLLIIWTWRRGSRLLFQLSRASETKLDELIRQLGSKPPDFVDGTAVFLTADTETAPTALMHSLKHYRVLHRRNVLLTVATRPQPRVPDDEKIDYEEINEHFARLTINYGFMEDPNLPAALVIARKKGIKFELMTTSFFLSRRSLVPSKEAGMPLWQDHLFLALSRNASDASTYFRLPTGRVVEIGAQVVI
ncbi:potassium transporter Kup [Pseudohoeflea suaedae]|uniref:Probable potassium transport system protein Kup n=1 Tax=Pseudohoeflea suaedae TaxID=877384 RepID=A0A4R5PQE5_9HYPH|nr:potassium transporter Kup [Pseudohoeflea suaedae]TDH39269.1 potassium transporter Kup [Pseudohoeflea suaedae]